MKNFRYKDRQMNGRRLLLALIVIILAITLCTSCDSEEPTAPNTTTNPPEPRYRMVTLQNSTGYTISSCYVRKPGSTNWNWISSNGSSYIPVDGSRSFVINSIYMDSQQTDICCSSPSGYVYYKYNQTITHDGTLGGTIGTIYISRYDAAPYVTINNNTGVTVHYFLFKLPGSTDWVSRPINPDIGFPNGMINGGSWPWTIDTSGINDENKSDIQLKTSSGALFTKLSQTINQNSAIAFTDADFDASGARIVTIVNNSGVAVNSILGRLPGSSSWDKTLSSISLANGSSQAVYFPIEIVNSTNHSDVQLKTSGGLLFTKLSQVINHNGIITFTSSDYDESGARMVTIRNNTGITVNSGYVKVQGSLVWNSLWTNSDISNGGSRLVTVSADVMNNNFQSDLQIRTSQGVLYTRLAQVIYHNGIITFTSSDFDDSGSRIVSIRNNTGVTVNSGYIKVPGSVAWTTLWTNSNVIDGNSISVTVSADAMNTAHQSDIQIRTSSGGVYTKYGYTIIQDAIIIFTSSDM